VLETRRRALVFGAVVSVVAIARAAPDDGFWSFLKPGRIVTRCAESSAAFQSARDRLGRLDERIERLGDADPPAPVVAELHALLKTECFLSGAETSRIPRPDTSLSLKTWWREGKGGLWVASLLEIPTFGEIHALKPHVGVPPDTRTTLNLEAHADHPLSRLLCPLADPRCGAATKGWRMRADAFVEAHRLRDRMRISASGEEMPRLQPDEISRVCAGKVADAAPGEKYLAWRRCLEERRTPQASLPLGNIRAPEGGWLVVSGRRGHYSFCDTTRAYDLATGAAFIDDSCSDLALQPDGSVDRDATRRARVGRVAAGSIPAQNLQEAVWMLLLHGEAEEKQLTAEFFPLPDGLEPRFIVSAGRPDDPEPDLPAWGSTSQTQLTWQWTPPSGPAFVGVLTWPDSSNAVEEHAAVLLDVAERGFVEGCVRGTVPPKTIVASPDARRLNDVEGAAVKELADDMTQALERWKTLRACEPRR